jgi:hypothetical protein
VVFFLFFCLRKRRDKKSHKTTLQKDHTSLNADQASGHDQLEVNWDEIEKQYSDVTPVSRTKPSGEHIIQLSSEGSNTITGGSVSYDTAERIKSTEPNELNAPASYFILKPDAA